jgi:hypothetical protein
LNLLSRDSIAVFDTGQGRGFSIGTPPFDFSLILRNYPVIRGVSTYWFGVYSNRTNNRWNNVSALNFSGGDSGCAWSWQGISIPAGGITTAGILFRSGVFLADPPELFVLPTSVSSVIAHSAVLNVSGWVHSFNGSVLVDLILVFDDDLSAIRFVGRSVVAAAFTLDIDIAEYNLSVGLHEAVFYAVDIPYGRISKGESFIFEVVLDATLSFSALPSRTVSVSFPRSVTRSPFATPFPTVTPIVPVRFGSTSSVYSFNLFGLDASAQVSIASGGFDTRMRISGMVSSYAYWGTPLIYQGVVLTHNSTQVSDCAILIVLKLFNSNAGIISVDIESDAAFWIDSLYAVAIYNLDEGRGFRLVPVNREFTFILRGYPLIRDVSTYWFGGSGDRLGNYWSQVNSSSFTTGSSGCS